CCVCLGWQADADDPIIFCDGPCGECVHLSCYALLHGVPDGDFFCESCEARQAQPRVRVRCALCFQGSGLMKRTQCGTAWAHPLCAMFTPELAVHSQSARLLDVTAVDRDRKHIKCGRCGVRGGAAVQCHHGSCMQAFHPYCAYAARMQM
ncbi:PHD-zinc-finger like domain-containing protein, partial [Ochromonadaceae sp. CCMP2298]